MDRTGDAEFGNAMTLIVLKKPYGEFDVWQKIDFAENHSDANDVIMSVEHRRGDLITVLPVEFVSDIENHLEKTYIVSGPDQMTLVPLAYENRTWFQIYGTHAAGLLWVLNDVLNPVDVVRLALRCLRDVPDLAQSPYAQNSLATAFLIARRWTENKATEEQVAEAYSLLENSELRQSGTEWDLVDAALHLLSSILDRNSRLRDIDYALQNRKDAYIRLYGKTNFVENKMTETSENMRSAVPLVEFLLAKVEYTRISKLR